jgi:hypothetical protein
MFRCRLSENRKCDNKSGTITAGIVGSAVLFVPSATVLPVDARQGHQYSSGHTSEVFASNDTSVDMGNAPAVVVPVAKVATPQSPEHVIEGYTISNSRDGMSADGNGLSVADAARQTKAKKAAAAAKAAAPSHRAAARLAGFG